MEGAKRSWKPLEDHGSLKKPYLLPPMEESRQEDNRSIGSSRDTVESLAKRVVDVETSMLDLKERVEVSRQHLEELGSDFSEIREDFKSDLNGLGGNLGCGILDLSDASKIKTVMRYLEDTTTLWWRCRYRDIERGTCTINTWADFFQDLKKQLYPKNAKHEAKSRLRKLKHSETIREYVKEFTTLVLEILDLSDQRLSLLFA
ncbi:putative retrotransposon gag domain, aspartic peptidase domain protein [Tanacetum coccineum]